MKTDCARRARPLSTWLIRALVVLLVAPSLALAPTGTSDGLTTNEIPLPQEWGIAVNQSDRLTFGSRTSSSVLAANAALLKATCTSPDRSETLGGDDELVRQGDVWARSEDGGGYVTTVDKTLPGFRWKVTYCVTETTTSVATVTCPPPYVVADYSVVPWVITWVYPPCYTTYQDQTTNSVSFVSKELVKHPKAEEWIKAAAKEALDKRETQDPPLDRVWWNSSPGYNSRQVVGLPTFFAASPVSPEVGDFDPTVGYDWGQDWPKLLDGYGGPTDPDTDKGEIHLQLEIDLPRSVWTFEDGDIECPGPGRLWKDGDESLAVADSYPADLCKRSWDTTAVESDNYVTNDDTVELKTVQLVYPYVLQAFESATIIEALGLVSGYVEKPGDPAAGTPVVVYAADEFGTEFNGGSRRLIVGEVQAYEVDRSNDLRVDAGAVASPWVRWEPDTCQTVGGWFLVGFLAGPLCELGTAFIDAHKAVLGALWDGFKLVSTVVKVVFSALWDIIKGCASIAPDIASDIVSIVETAADWIDDPSGEFAELQATISLIKGELSKPDTRWEFVQEVLTDIGAEFISLDMIAHEVDTDGDGIGDDWQLLDDPDWFGWGGRMTCEVILAFFGGKFKDALKSTKIAEKISDWLRRRDIDLPELPKLKPCTVKTIARGVEWTGNALDVYEVAANNVPTPGENNSFPAGTLVLGSDGTFAPIEDLEPGQAVLSYDLATGDWESQPIVAQWSAFDDGDLAAVALSDGTSITATDGHRFWVDSRQAWVELEDVRPGDQLLTPTGTATAQAVDVWDTPGIEVWELTVAENHNYVVSMGGAGVLVHNSCKGGGGGGGGNGNFTQDVDGNVTYDSDLTDTDINDVRLDADGNPMIIKGDGFEIVLKTDGTITIIEAGPPVRVTNGGVINPDGSVVVPNPDGTQTIIDADGDRATIDTDETFDCNSFLAGTKVLMADGTHRAIERVEVGELVASFDVDSENWVNGEVVGTWAGIDNGVIGTIMLSDGAEIAATDHHRFWVSSKRAWVRLVDVEPGDLLLTPQGTPQVTSVRLARAASTVVFELDIAGPDNFTVQADEHDLLVHNCDVSYATDLDGNPQTIIVNEKGRTQTTTNLPDGTRVVVQETPDLQVKQKVTTLNPDGSIATVVKTYDNRTVTTDTVTSVLGNPQTRTRTEYTETTEVNGTQVPPGTVVVKKGAATSTTLPDGSTIIQVGDPGTRTVINEDGTVEGSNYDPATPSTTVPANGINPPRVSGPTTGVARGPNGEIIHIQSGAGGPAMTDVDLNNPTPDIFDHRSHVEGHTASYMRQNNITEMVVSIDHTGGVCPSCQQGVPAMVPPGGVLHVISPDGNGGVRVQSITNAGVVTVTNPAQIAAIQAKADSPATQ